MEVPAKDNIGALLFVSIIVLLVIWFSGLAKPKGKTIVTNTIINNVKYLDTTIRDTTIIRSEY